MRALVVACALGAWACSNQVAGGSELPLSDDPTAERATDEGVSADPTTLETAVVDETPKSAAAPGRCDRSKPFDAPVLAAGLASATYDTGARLSPDELTALFSRTDASGDADILVATRSDRSGPWTGAKTVGELSSAYADGAPTLTADALTLFLHSSRTGTAGDLDIWVARRATTSVGWGAPARVAALSGPAKDGDPYVRADGRGIVMASNRSGNFDLYEASISASGVVGAPSPITELDTSADESNPVITPDGLTIYFARRGASLDILVARRPSADAPFGKPAVAAELTTSSDERPTWVSADDCVLYFSSTRAGGAGSSDVYIAERPR